MIPPMKKLLSAALSLCLALSLCTPAFAAANSLDNFQQTATYNNNFSDVSATSWAASAVETCYEYGLMNGTGNGRFSPNGTLSVAEALVMADRVHAIYTTGESTLENGSPWYQPYVDYAIENGIIQEGDFNSYTANATRAEMAYIFANALPDSALPAINDIDTLPDVEAVTPYATEIFTLYNAGVLTGSDVYGTCNPSTTITRAEAAAIIARVAIAEERREVTLLMDVLWGSSITLAMPQDTQDVSTSEYGMFTASNAAAVLVSDTNSLYQGMSITVLPADMLDSLLNDVFTSAGMPFTGSDSAQVSFGAIDAYRTAGTLSYEGYQADCVLYTYISGSTLNIIALLSLDDDDTLLTNMANNVRVTSSSVSPKLS